MFDRKLRVLVTVFFFFLSYTANCKSYPKKCPDVKTLAKELVMTEFYGRRSSEYNKCLKKLKVNSFWKRPMQVDDSSYKFPKILHWIEDKDSIKILKVSAKEISERFLVQFSYKVGNKIKKDSLVFEVYQGQMKKMVGCGAIVTPPKKLSLLKECK